MACNYIPAVIEAMVERVSKAQKIPPQDVKRKLLQRDPESWELVSRFYEQGVTDIYQLLEPVIWQRFESFHRELFKDILPLKFRTPQRIQDLYLQLVLITLYEVLLEEAQCENEK